MCRKCRIAAKRGTLLLSITITAYIEIVEIDKKFYLKKFFVHEELMDWEKKRIRENEYERDILKESFRILTN